MRPDCFYPVALVVVALVANEVVDAKQLLRKCCEEPARGHTGGGEFSLLGSPFWGLLTEGPKTIHCKYVRRQAIQDRA